LLGKQWHQILKISVVRNYWKIGEGNSLIQALVVPKEDSDVANAIKQRNTLHLLETTPHERIEVI
jgi:hypothetical protein